MLFETLIRTRVGATVDDVRIGLVVGITDAWGEPGAGFKQSHGGHLPTARDGVPPASGIQEGATLTEGQLVETSEKEAQTAGSFNVAVIIVDMEAIGNGDAVVDFTGKGRRVIALIVGEVLRESVAGVGVEPVRHLVALFDFKRVVVGFAGVKRCCTA